MSDQPKLGEWTTLNAVDQAELRSLREKVMELEQQLAAAEKALSEEVDCVHKTLMQLAAEREKLEQLLKLLESDTSKGSALRNQPLINIIHSVITRKNQPHPMKLDFTKTYDLDDPEIRQLREQLAAEREKVQPLVDALKANMNCDKGCYKLGEAALAYVGK